MYQVERTSPEVLTVRHGGIAAGWQQRYLLMSDVHEDSPYCDKKLLIKHLDQAKDIGAGVCIFGDWFDAMGGKADKRSHKSGIRPEHQADNYFDRLVDNAAVVLEPYADILVIMTLGNHETAILKHQETDLLHRLTQQLGCVHGGYAGFIRFMFEGITANGHKGSRTTIRAHYHHGSGGGGPVTKNMIANNRKASAIWSDIFIGGHTHTTGYDENEVTKLTDSGRIISATTYHITMPSYKRESFSTGFHTEKGRYAKSLGGWWLKFEYDSTQVGNVRMGFERAN
jgi:hypothetical protein